MTRISSFCFKQIFSLFCFALLSAYVGIGKKTSVATKNRLPLNQNFRCTSYSYFFFGVRKQLVVEKLNEAYYALYFAIYDSISCGFVPLLPHSITLTHVFFFVARMNDTSHTQSANKMNPLAYNSTKYKVLCSN